MNEFGGDETAPDGDTDETEEPAAGAPAISDEPIEPGSPSAENVAFVLLGVLGALYVIAQIAGLV